MQPMIRRFEPADLPALQVLLASLQDFVAGLDPLGRSQPFPDGGAAYTAAQLDRLATETGGTILLAAIENKIVGCVMGCIRPGREHSIGMITEFVVLPEYRGRGIGRGLMAAIESEFDAAGCGELQANAYSFNSGARTFYEKAGFEPRTIEYFKSITKQ